MISNVVLVSSIQKSDSVIHILVSIGKFSIKSEIVGIFDFVAHTALLQLPNSAVVALRQP